ncbi:hypothetical protein Spla01_02525 [Streptomyces platensis]|uniref:Uncharacterized protein n=1 Tax=Streptomyces platensis TaxID=58346 RepID=A0ABX3XV75_STRPT|nr:hypothetical protein BG653_03748 [Streptomyces platensis]
MTPGGCFKSPSHNECSDFTKQSRGSRPIWGFLHRSSPVIRRSFSGDARNADTAREGPAQRSEKPGQPGHVDARSPGPSGALIGVAPPPGNTSRARGGARRRCAAEVRNGGNSRSPPTKARHACVCGARAGAGWRSGHRPPVRGGTGELRGCDRWFRSVVAQSLRWSLLLWLRLSPAGSPVVAGLRPSRRLRVVHLCVGFTWNTLASTCSSRPASRSAYEPASASVAASVAISVTVSVAVSVAVSACASNSVAMSASAAAPNSAAGVRLCFSVSFWGSPLRAAVMADVSGLPRGVRTQPRASRRACAVRLRRSGRCAHGCGPPE